jgi:hypothetical protein
MWSSGGALASLLGCLVFLGCVPVVALRLPPANGCQASGLMTAGTVLSQAQCPPAHPANQRGWAGMGVWKVMLDQTIFQLQECTRQ